MDLGTTFESVLKDHKPFVIEEQKPDVCEHGRDFSQWVEGTLLPEVVTESPTPKTINKAILLLTLHFMECKRIVPKGHWHKRTDRGHVCVRQLFEQTCERLIGMLLIQKPDLYYEPPAKPHLEEKYRKVDPLIGLEIDG